MPNTGQKIAPRRPFMVRIVEMAEKEHKLAARKVSRAEDKARACRCQARLKEAKAAEKLALSTLTAVREERLQQMTPIQRELTEGSSRRDQRTPFSDRLKR